MRKWSVTIAFVASILMLVTVKGQQLNQSVTTPANAFVVDEILVQFSPALNTAQRNATVARRNATRLRRFAAIDLEHLKLPPGVTVEAALAAFRAMPGVALAQPNYTRKIIGTTPNDPYWLDGSLWGLGKIQAPSVWSGFTTGDGSVIVASIDTGVDYTHPDLAANMWRNPLEIAGNGIDDDGNGYVDDVFGIDTVNHDSDPIDDQGHGTHTSGTIAAIGHNNEGVVGVNWNARVLPCKFLSAAGSGTDAGAIECFNYLVALRSRGENIRVTSNSWGALRGGEPPSAALQAAIDAAGAVGIINIFGAGNDGVNTDNQPFDPASYASPSIVSVASSGSTDRKSFFSNYGLSSVDLAAPGEDILSTYPGGGYSYSSGTSMAAPHVAGVAALLVKLDPTLTPDGIKALLLEHVDQSSKWTGKVASGGRLNAFTAASAIGVGTPNEPPTVVMTGPASGGIYKAPVTIVLEAAASDSDGSVQHVAFYANGLPIGSDATSPYSVTWAGAAPGTYTLTAVATDDRYATATSTGVHVVIEPNAPPAVSITSPADGASFASPATFTIDAAATDIDGVVQQVTFYANGVAIGTDATSPYTATWSGPLGAYTLTAVATDNTGGSATSAAINVTVTPIPGRVNVALAANGGIASASSVLGANYPASGAINGEHRGLGWGSGGAWSDGTQNASPDWLEVRFPGMKLIEEIGVFSMQDNYSAPIEPTPATTFAYFGLRGFEVQYWDGVDWLTIPSGVVTTNNLVWRRFVFAPLTTSRIRVFITAALNGYSRVMEVEAFGVSAGGNVAPSVAITAPAGGAGFTAPAAITISAAASDDDGSIASVAFFANGAPIGTDSSSPFSLAWTGVAEGSYSLTAVATDNQGATTSSAAVDIAVAAANVPPSVSITAPVDGAAFTSPANIVVAASASDSDGSIASVAFFANGAAIGTDASSPYSIAWNGVGDGTYILTAIATDNAGATTPAAAVYITVNQPPGRSNVALAVNGGIALASSTLGANYPASGAINGEHRGLQWGAGGAWSDGTQNASPDWIEVRFAGFKAIDEVGVFSMQDAYTAPIEPTPATTFSYFGLRAFEVQYWDGAAWVMAPGASVTNNNLVWRRFTFAPITTNRIRVFVTAALNGYSRVMEVEAFGYAVGGNVAPDVSISSPATGAAFNAPATVTINAAASDSDGSVASVTFFANGAPIGTDTTSPYSVTWTGVAEGSYAITAMATDNLGAASTSAAVNVTVAAANAAPSVTLTSPVEGATFTSPATITVTAGAIDSDGSIASVVFFANGAAIGTDITSPYSASWANVPAGAYALTAVATDNQGAVTTSAAVHVTVSQPVGRMNMALAANGGVATASSTLNGNYPAAGAINGDRRGIGWGAGGGWNDGTLNASPDWIEVAFNGPRTIDEINVFSMQDTYTAPLDPTLAMTFGYFGLRAFEVQYWNGAAWVAVPGGTITNNNRVWRQVLFAPITTTRIRVHVTQALNGYSRVIEVEAWGMGG